MPKKRIILLLVLLLLARSAGRGFVAYLKFFPAEPPAEEPQPPAPKVAMGPVYAMRPFLVNLADPVSAKLDALKRKVCDALLTPLSGKG